MTGAPPCVGVQNRHMVLHPTTNQSPVWFDLQQSPTPNPPWRRPVGWVLVFVTNNSAHFPRAVHFLSQHFATWVRVDHWNSSHTKMPRQRHPSWTIVDPPRPDRHSQRCFGPPVLVDPFWSTRGKILQFPRVRTRFRHPRGCRVPPPHEPGGAKAGPRMGSESRFDHV